MNRDEQIDLLRNAEERRRGFVASWAKDPRVQETLKKNRENAKRLKADASTPPRSKVG